MDISEFTKLREYTKYKCKFFVVRGASGSAWIDFDYGSDPTHLDCLK